MRRILTALVLLVAAAPALAQSGGKIKWTPGKPDQVSEDVAREAGVKTCVYFTARWEPTCRKLDEGPFSDEAVLKAAADWHCVIVDLSDLKAWEIAKARQKLKGVPTVRYYAKDGTFVDEVVVTIERDAYLRKFQGESLLYRVHPKDRAAAIVGDSHRVTLRNGNVIDCVLVEMSEAEVIVMWDKQSEARIKREEIVRIELLRIRPLGEEAPDVGGTVKPPPGKKLCAACRTVEVTAEGEKCAECARGGTPPKPVVEPEQGVKQVVDRLVTKLVEMKKGNSPPEDRDPIVEELSKVGTEGLSYAVRIAATGDPEIAVWIFAAVTRVKDKSVAPAIRQQLETSSNSEMIVYMINALTALEDRDAARALAKIAVHPNSAVRGAAIEGMGALGNRDTIHELAKAVVDPERQVRAKATGSIVTLAKKFEMENAAYFAVRTAAGNAPEARRDYVPLVCSQLGAAEAVSMLIDYLRSATVDVRANSVTALADLGGTDALETFYAMLETETESRVRMLICNALGKLKDVSAVGKLVDLMGTEKEQDVKLAASRALQILTRQKFGPDPEQWKKWWEAQRGVKPGEKKEEEEDQ